MVHALLKLEQRPISKDRQAKGKQKVGQCINWSFCSVWCAAHWLFVSKMLALSSNNDNNKKNTPSEVRIPFSLCLLSSSDIQSLILGPLHFNMYLLWSLQVRYVLPIVPVTFHDACCTRPHTQRVPRLRISQFARGSCWHQTALLTSHSFGMCTHLKIRS